MLYSNDALPDRVCICWWWRMKIRGGIANGIVRGMGQ
jgi:hypothetical protein